MGALPTPLSAELLPWVTASVVAVAYSGGRDSTALLHATCQAAMAAKEAASESGQAGPTVVALHVHHGLSPLADAWVAHGRAQCAQWAAQGAPLRFQFERLEAQPRPGDSIEAWARRARYEALGRMAKVCGASQVLLAHHRRDQAETFLLQALRGAGAAGLSAMASERMDSEGLRWCRPWLHRSREDIEAYVLANGLDFIDDDSNADRRFARNRLRLEVWPGWVEAFPRSEAALTEAAQRASEAQACLDELAEMDLAVVAPRGPLLLSAWLTLSPPRRGNALRAWLKRMSGARVTRSLLARLGQELLDAGAGPARWACGSGELRRYRGELSWCSMQSGPAAEEGRSSCLVMAAPGQFEMPDWGGCLRVYPVASGGLAWVPGMTLSLRSRVGSEQFQAGPRQIPRALKKQFQARHVPAWNRRGPLLYLGEQLVFVPGLGLDARALARDDGPQVGLAWETQRGEPTEGGSQHLPSQAR